MIHLKFLKIESQRKIGGAKDWGNFAHPEPYHATLPNGGCGVGQIRGKLCIFNQSPKSLLPISFKDVFSIKCHLHYNYLSEFANILSFDAFYFTIKIVII